MSQLILGPSNILVVAEFFKLSCQKTKQNKNKNKDNQKKKKKKNQGFQI